MSDPSWPQAWTPISYTEDEAPQVRAGGKPKTSTPADKRLKENRGATKNAPAKAPAKPTTKRK